MIGAGEVRAAVELMDVTDDSQWDENGKPRIEVIRQFMADAAVTEDDIDEAMGAGFKRPADTAKARGVDPKNPPKPSDEEGMRGALPIVTVQEVVAHAQASLDGVKPILSELEQKRVALEAAIAEHQKVADQAIDTIEQHKETLTHADMVKRIQAQTQERARAAAERQAKLNAALGGNARPVLSPLDAALAAGTARTRSRVLINGKVFAAPDPRSSEGVRAYAAWVHANGPQRPI